MGRDAEYVPLSFLAYYFICYSSLFLLYASEIRLGKRFGDSYRHTTWTKKAMVIYCLLQVYGVLDVQRVAGNFHISVHGLNIFVAQMVSSRGFYVLLWSDFYNDNQPVKRH